MKTRKSTKRALLLSVCSIMLCLVMLIGTTFAWFTDTASTAVNTIQSGTLDIELLADDGVTSLEGKTLTWKKAEAGKEQEILWEPGCTYELQPVVIKNAGNLALKYKLQITGIKGDAKLNEAIEWTIEGASLDGERPLLPGASEKLTIKGHMKKEAGNEYQGLTIDGIGITVYATQYTHEYDSYGNQYDKDASRGTAYYTLAEFNALSEIPADVDTVYVNMNGVSLKDGLVIGNKNLADHYNYTNWDDDTAPAGYPYKTGRTDVKSDGAIRYLYSTGKPAVNVILTGSVDGAADTGDFNAGLISLQVPDAATVTFDKVTFGAGQMAMSVWAESFQSTVVSHRIAHVVFSGCTFNGNWIQNGAFGADDMVIRGCTFNVHENTGYKNNSNPIWIQNLGQCNVTIDGNTVNAVRPIKLWEGTASGTVTITNNKFNMSNFADATGSDVYKNVAVMFCHSTLNNVEISGNTVTGSATGFVCFYDSTDHYPTMIDGATFKIHNNTLNGTKESVLWKTATEWAPDYVTK